MGVEPVHYGKLGFTWCENQSRTPSPRRPSMRPTAAAVKAHDELAALGLDGGSRRPKDP